MIEQDEPITLYNTEKKEVVGIFRNKVLLGRYVWPLLGGNASKYASKYLIQKQRIIESRLGYIACIRYASAAHIETLGENDVVIMDGYEPHSTTITRGFHSTRSSLAKEAAIHQFAVHEERKRKAS